jgi:hypothetical protein
MNVPGNDRDLEERRDLEEHNDGKWNTIRYAIGGWDTTVRLSVVLVVLLGPAYLAYLIVWLTHR